MKEIQETATTAATTQTTSTSRNEQNPPAVQPRIVIVGAGFGGLKAAQALRHANARVTVIDRQNHHLFQPLLYWVATAGLSPADISSPIRSILSRQKNTEVMMAEVTGVDLAQQRVLMGEHAVPYDYLVLATGAHDNYFGHPEWEQHAPGLKSITDATSIRRKILLAFEAAEIESDPQKIRSLLTFVLVGAGPTGVEMSGAIAELAHKALASDFRHIDTKSARIILVEAAPRILPAYLPELSGRAAERLRREPFMSCGIEKIEGEIQRRRFLRQSPDPGCGGMNPLQQFVERKRLAVRHDDFAVEQELARRQFQRGVDQFWKVARQVFARLRAEIYLVAAAVEQAVGRFGGIDVCVNNASAINLSGTEALEIKRYDLMQSINTRGTFVVSRAAIPHLKRSANPHILTLSPPVSLEPRWLGPHVGYTIAKYGMTLCALGFAAEFAADGIASNALWPRTLIATAAVQNLLGGEAAMARARRPELYADAAYAVITRPSRECTGNAFLCEDVLAAEGVTDFARYAYQPGTEPEADLFVDHA